MASELKPFGYAPGSYMNNCKSCGQSFMGDKRAWNCEPCAKALSLQADTRPAPAATDTGLETVAQAYVNEDGECEEIAWIEGLFPHPECIQLVTRSQAVELLAAERAEKEELDAECRVLAKRCIEKDARIKELSEALETEKNLIRGDWACQRDVDQMSIKVEALEAKLAAAEAGRDRVRRIFRRNTRLRFEAEKRAEVIEAKYADAEKSAFEHGYVLACCNIINLHDEPTIAHDTLSELGVTRAAVKAMNLSEYDLKALRKIERDRSRSPYAKASRKARAVLGGKPS
ncbi:hypothetical protein [Brucella sp. BZ]|uniref:hypothetical protein n=1 Tax=Brucella sp. BZ TaxID=3381346 RepID=UPI0039ED61A7